MNAVEAVEQLGAMGRKLQAREVGLQQPSLRLQMALRQVADWETVLGDPMAALSQLLGAAGGGQVPAREVESASPPASPLPPAPFRWEEDRLPRGSGMPAAPSEPGSEQGSGMGPRSGAPSGVRLARRQTSLLGILNANLEDRVYAKAGEQGATALMGGAAPIGDVRPEERQAGQNESLSVPAGPLVRWSAVPAPAAAEDEVRQPGGEAARAAPSVLSLTSTALLGSAASRARQDLAGAGGGLTGDAGAEMNVLGYEPLPQHAPESTVHSVGRREPAPGKVDDLASGMPAARGEEPVSFRAGLDSQARTEGQAGEWGGWPQNVAVAQAAQDGDWVTAHERQGEWPLSMAQIEQVLAALDERLELGLLRLYGSAGGLP